MDSVFSLRRPYDLMGLLAQEERAHMVESLKKELLQRKEEIDRCEDQAQDVEQRLYAADHDCLIAAQPLTEFDLYVSTVVPFDHKIKSHSDEMLPEEMPQPNCSKVMDLNFSMHAFEHLAGVRERHALNMTPEAGLHRAVSTIESTHEFGHQVYKAMAKNNSSWVIFNLAAYYWREKGAAAEAVECVRRALHFSPREHKDVALISLGNILHRSHLSEEAAIVVHAAVDTAPDNAICHFTLGNIYAVLADYNKSVICFENTLKVQPDFKNAKQRLHAVLCHSKLEAALEAQHNSLQRMLGQLHEYQERRELWLQKSEQLIGEQASPERTLEQHVLYQEHRLRQKPNQQQKGHSCFQLERNGHALLSCNVNHIPYHVDSLHDLGLNQQFVQAVESRASRLIHKVHLRSSSVHPEQCRRT
ncbi:tetratricopeptide repeat protein 17-like isoform X2 [Ornithodoros turicata]